jgi:D-alanyl-lipoteichoic acid acyltransferase DltB (MBOAT superfamily)
VTITEILLLVGVAVLYRLITSTSWGASARGWILLILSTVAIFWLQPAMPIRFLDFWFPVLTLAITIFSWLLTAEKEERRNHQNLTTVAVILLLILLVALTRFLSLDGILTANRPPQPQQVLIGLIILTTAGAALGWIGKSSQKWLGAGILFILLVFVFLKLPALTLWLSSFLRNLVGQSTANASPLDIRWLGFSYVAFRLIHTLRDRQAGRLPAVSLQNYINYVIFFPSISAGPINKLPRFDKDFQKPLYLNFEIFGSSFTRLVIGLFKKFALADTLGLIALNSQNATQLQPNGWGWVMVYAYTFQIFFDISGYTDIAIGLGQLLGIQLPENFNKPYLRPNLTQFWNNWHMTLTQWIRAYFFNPFTRSLRSKYRNLSPTWVILITQLSTMIMIALWHGITWNFVLWGVWHGLGMFVQNRYSDWVKPHLAKIEDKPKLQRGITVINVGLTFHFVALGWIWFALPQVSLSLNVFMKLFGIGG